MSPGIIHACAERAHTACSNKNSGIILQQKTPLRHPFWRYWAGYMGYDKVTYLQSGSSAAIRPKKPDLPRPNHAAVVVWCGVLRVSTVSLACACVSAPGLAQMDDNTTSEGLEWNPMRLLSPMTLLSGRLQMLSKRCKPPLAHHLTRQEPVACRPDQSVAWCFEQEKKSLLFSLSRYYLQG